VGIVLPPSPQVDSPSTVKDFSSAINVRRHGTCDGLDRPTLDVQHESQQVTLLPDVEDTAHPSIEGSGTSVEPIGKLGGY
jgi:hypothetical protein